ncbi:hypothetical protein JL721_9875 [Aureococcus anophagefferens]|nr:hypothetical protein JL721_9875 [Aureococcus anophagefferens]
MPKNKGKGGKNRRRGKNENRRPSASSNSRPGQEYSQVVRMLGNGRCECYCFDGVTRLGHIRGKMRKKVWVSAGDIVLVGLREYQDDKVDIIHKYNADEARNLKQYGELPETARINETAVDMAMEGGGERRHRHRLRRDLKVRRTREEGAALASQRGACGQAAGPSVDGPLSRAPL